MVKTSRDEELRPRLVPSSPRKKEHREKEKTGRANSWGREARAILAPKISRGHFFFRVTHDGLRERGSTRSLRGATYMVVSPDDKSGKDGRVWERTYVYCPDLDCSQRSVFSYFYSIVERADGITRELDASEKRTCGCGPR